MRPDLSVPRHPFARSPVGPSQHQLYDVKTLGSLPIYHRSYRVQPADQRARAVPGECLRSAIECDRTWNGTLPGSVGTFEAYLRTTQHPRTQKSFRGGAEVRRRDSVEEYIFSDTKDLDENRWFQDPDGSRNPGTNGSSDPGR